VGDLAKAKGQDYNGRGSEGMNLTAVKGWLRVGDLSVAEAAMLDESTLKDFWIDCRGWHGVSSNNTGFSMLISTEATPWITVHEEIS